MLSANLLKPGFVINSRFEIVRLLGQGGFAMVFEGLDRNLDRQVAIKVLHGAVLAKSGEDTRVLERFTREAKLAASLDHPSVVNIYDAGEIEGGHEPFIVMEYLKGVSLQDHLDRNGGMDPAKLIPLFRDVLVGLGFAHELGIVHKDLKPDNIFYRYPGTIRESLCIVDFGIAHIGRSNSQRVTRDGEFFGTPSYMPPEYIKEQRVSPAFDVYQMGLILVECLTGQPVVHHPDSVATLLMHLNRQWRVPQALLRSEAWPVIERALHINPELRYKDAMAFAEALAAVPDGAWPSRSALALKRLEPDETLGAAFGGGGLGEEATAPELDGAALPEGVMEGWRSEESLRTVTSSTRATLSPTHITDGESDASAESSRDEDPHASDAARARQTRLFGALILLVMLIAGAALGALALYDRSADSGDPTPPSLATNKTADEIVAQPPVEEEEPPDAGVVVEAVAAAGEPDSSPDGEPPVEVVVTLESEPSGALVEEGGAPLGKTPLPVSFASAKAPARSLTLTLRQHEPLTLTLSPNTASPSRHALARAKRTTPPPKKGSGTAPVQPSQSEQNVTPPVDKKPPGILLPK